MIIDAVDCPTCKAKAGKMCLQKNGVKEKSSAHHDRMKAAQKFHGFKVKKKRASTHKGKPGFYQSWEWKAVRYEALKMHGNRCMCCGWEPQQGNKGRLCVDHIKPRSKFPKLSLEVSNLQVLCSSCNMGKSNKHFDDFRESYNHDQDADEFWMDRAFSGTIQ